MKLFKSETEAEKAWLAVVSKMREAEVNGRKKNELEDYVNAIIYNDKVTIRPIHKKSPKKASTKE